MQNNIFYGCIWNKRFYCIPYFPLCVLSQLLPPSLTCLHTITWYRLLKIDNINFNTLIKHWLSIHYTHYKTWTVLVVLKIRRFASMTNLKLDSLHQYISFISIQPYNSKHTSKQNIVTRCYCIFPLDALSTHIFVIPQNVNTFPPSRKMWHVQVAQTRESLISSLSPSVTHYHFIVPLVVHELLQTHCHQTACAIFEWLRII